MVVQPSMSQGSWARNNDEVRAERPVEIRYGGLLLFSFYKMVCWLSSPFLSVAPSGIMSHCGVE